jgi:photosystem II stability/assembly factor-like uncharacterized protein
VRSDDGGGSWTFFGAPARSAIVDIAVSPDDQPLIMAAAGRDGLWSWSQTDQQWKKVPVPLSEVESVIFSDHTPGTLYAAGRSYTKGLYVSRDYGLTWTPVVSDVGLQLIIEDPSDPAGATIVTGTEYTGILFSKDGGQRWTSLGAPPGHWTGNRASLIVDDLLLLGTSEGLWAYDLSGLR